MTITLRALTGAKARHHLTALIAASAVAGAVLAAPANATPSPRIIGGNVVPASSVPWTVAIMTASQPNGYQAQFCGGSLIDQSWVLTAAHCVDGTSASAIDVGWGQSLLSQMTAANRHAVSEVIVHPSYNAANDTADIALLKLTTAVPSATTIDINSNATWSALNDSVSTYGWGNISTSGTTYPDDLRGVNLVDMAGPSGACGNYGSSYDALHMLCAGVPGGGKDACQGDSGGPLVMPTPGNPTVPLLIGVTSWGNGCALNGYPGLWSRVSTYHPWITKTMTRTKPAITIGSATITEGDTGTRIAKFTVSLSRKPGTTVTIPYSTANGTATSGSDYVAKSGTLSFSASSVTKTISVTIKGDTFVEGNENFVVVLGSTPLADPLYPPFSSVGAGTITDDDPNGSTPAITIGDATTYEGDEGASQTIQLTVSLSVASATPVTVSYTTVNGTATSGSDFVAKSGTLTVTGTARVKYITISVKPDYFAENFADEAFSVSITPSANVVPADTSGAVTILGDEA